MSDSVAIDSRPRKKARLLGPPTGFTTPPKAMVKTIAPRFASGFGQDQHTIPSKDNPTDKPPSAARKPVHRNFMALPPDLRPLHSTTTTTATTSKGAKDRIPIKDLMKEANSVLMAKNSPGGSSTTAKRPLGPIPPLTIPLAAKVATPLKQLAPPSLPQPRLQPVLKSHIPPPPVLPPPVSPPRSLRTITTTTIARATDLSAEGGAAEVASIFLKDVLLPTAPSTPTRRHKLRGLELTPEKEKGKKGKFMRGGLAARAAGILSQTQNSLSLWQTDIGHQLTTERRPIPDLRLRIEKILHVPVAPVNSISPPTSIPGIALCRILTKTTIPNLIASRLELHRTIFSFPFTGSNATTRNVQDFIEGREVYVWTPWDQLRYSASFTPHTDGDMVVSSVMLACTRFVILP